MTRLVAVCLAVATAGLMLACSSQPRQTDRTVSERIDSAQQTRAGHGEMSALTREQLQRLVMGMADTYAERAKQVVKFEMETDSPRERFIVHAQRYNLVSAAYDIAVSPHPEVAVLDMLVLVSLTRITASRLNEREFEGRIEVVVTELTRLEADIWRDAERVLSEEHRQDLRTLIESYAEANPNLMMAGGIRFNSFVDIKDVDTARQARGLLREIGQAAQVADAMRLLAERTLWYSSRLPVVLGMQVEHTVFGLALEPEVQQVLNDSLRFTDATDRVAEELTLLPDHLAQEREAILAAFDAREADARALVVELGNTIEAGQVLADSMTQTALAVDNVLKRFEPPPGQPRRPLDVTNVTDAASQTALAADEMTELLEVARDLLASPHWDDRATNIGAAWGQVREGPKFWIRYAFWRALLLIGVALVAMLVFRWLTNRFFPKAVVDVTHRMPEKVG